MFDFFRSTGSKKVKGVPVDESFQVTAEQINFFDTFGFLKIPRFFVNEINSIKVEFNRMMTAKFGAFDEPRSYLYPQILDNSPQLTKLLELDKINNLMAGLLGGDFLFKGSDGNVFQASSTWHRDYLIRTKSCKMLIYLDPSDSNSGAFRAIPGSQFVDDAYSNFLSRALTWPDPPFHGGFDEKGVFGKGHNPTELGRNAYIPQVVVNNEPGDVIIFNHNLVHCTNAMIKPIRRKMLGIHFCVNPYSEEFVVENEATRNEMSELTRAEMETFELPTAYGACVMNSTSPRIQRMIGPLKNLKHSTNADFNGLYPKKSPLHQFFVDYLKSDIHLRKRRVN